MVEVAGKDGGTLVCSYTAYPRAVETRGVADRTNVLLSCEYVGRAVDKFTSHVRCEFDMVHLWPICCNLRRVWLLSPPPASSLSLSLPFPFFPPQTLSSVFYLHRLPLSTPVFILSLGHSRYLRPTLSAGVIPRRVPPHVMMLFIAACLRFGSILCVQTFRSPRTISVCEFEEELFD